MRVLSTGRFSLLVVKGGMEKEPQDWVLRLSLLSGGEHGVVVLADWGWGGNMIIRRSKQHHIEDIPEQHPKKSMKTYISLQSHHCAFM